MKTNYWCPGCIQQQYSSRATKKVSRAEAASSLAFPLGLIASALAFYRTEMLGSSPSFWLALIGWTFWTIAIDTHWPCAFIFGDQDVLLSFLRQRATAFPAHSKAVWKFSIHMQEKEMYLSSINRWMDSLGLNCLYQVVPVSLLLPHINLSFSALGMTTLFA